MRTGNGSGSDVGHGCWRERRITGKEVKDVSEWNVYD